MFLAVLGLMGWAAGTAWADEPDSSKPDGFSLTLSETLSYDDNLFRLPSGTDPQPFTGKSERSSLIRTDLLGVGFDKRYSQQELHVAASVARYNYSNYDYLDFNASNGSLAWNWAFTPHLTGIVLAERTQTLNSFDDYRNLTTRNIRTNDNRVAGLDYELLGSWHVFAYATRYSSVSDDNSVALEDAYTSNSAQAGIKYVFPSASYISYIERKENGDYPGGSAQSPTLIDSGFDQRDHEIQAGWVLSGHTTLTGQIDRKERDHPNFAQRDYSGTVGQVSLSWKPTGKTTIVATAGRDFATYQTVYSNYIATDTLSIAPTWQITPKTALKAKLSRSSRDYLGEPFGPVAERRDTINSGQLELDWQAARSITVAAILEHDRRDSSYSGFDFTDTTATLNLRLVF